MTGQLSWLYGLQLGTCQQEEEKKINLAPIDLLALPQVKSCRKRYDSTKMAPHGPNWELVGKNLELFKSRVHQTK